MDQNREKRINLEYNRLKCFYKALPENQMGVVENLIQNSAFMCVALQDLQEIINENGASEEYQNGKDQSGRKASADLQAYNSLIKNYSSIQGKLLRLLPKEEVRSQSIVDLVNSMIEDDDPG